MLKVIEIDFFLSQVVIYNPDFCFYPTKVSNLYNPSLKTRNPFMRLELLD